MSVKSSSKLQLSLGLIDHLKVYKVTVKEGVKIMEYTNTVKGIDFLLVLFQLSMELRKGT